MCAEQRGFHRKKCSGVTSGSPFPLMPLWISLHYVSLLCCCPVENTWTQGTNAIVCPWLWRKRWLLSLQWPRCCFCWSFGALEVHFKSNDNPLLERRIPVRSAGLCSCWAHTRKEGRGGLTDGERKSRLRPPPTAMENSDLPARVCCKERRKVVFLCQPRWDLATSCCETAILQGEISWAALPAWEILQAFMQQRKEMETCKKHSHLAK